MAGTENQCLAIADYLDVKDVEVKRIGLKKPFDLLCPPILKTAPKWAITGIDWNAPAPDIIIASGRKAVPVTLQFPNAFSAFIQNPRIAPRHFDLCAIPEHDKIYGDNVIITRGAPNRISQNTLDKAKSKLDLSALPDKKVAILIGGNSKSHSMDDQFAHRLYDQLMPFMQSGDYGFMVTASRRTPDHIRDQLNNIFNGNNCIFWDGMGENPYHGYLAHADYILVSEDSTSMLSDALTTGKPTYRLRLNGGSEKFDRLYQNLKRRALLRIFDGTLDHWEYKPLNDAKHVADEIKKRFDKRT